MRRPSARTRRLAVALWNLERAELQGDVYQPAFHVYADGKREPMPFHRQIENHQQFWLSRARQLLRAINRKGKR